MKQVDARTWRRHALVVVTVILLPALGAHPELFSSAPGAMRSVSMARDDCPGSR
ncbi:hypothetical protein [Dyella ginsengisoli]|uniref:hypothetical protein n=1 Tax=Dyella ginsengisoli TaxID=363848 RepID=UPI00034A880B|nr:hypothetical protein [Dyella ginsengisoli]